MIVTFGSIFVRSYKASNKPAPGYYRYHDADYYYQNDNWYIYNVIQNDWYVTNASNDPSGVITGKNVSDYQIENHEGKSFESSVWYQEPKESTYDSSSDSSWDSGGSWDSGSSWDSGGTDWSSDW